MSSGVTMTIPACLWTFMQQCFWILAETLTMEPLLDALAFAADTNMTTATIINEPMFIAFFITFT
jgi:hypothetical protein